jgi:hypothetical protein
VTAGPENKATRITPPIISRMMGLPSFDFHWCHRLVSFRYRAARIAAACYSVISPSGRRVAVVATGQIAVMNGSKRFDDLEEPLLKCLLSRHLSASIDHRRCITAVSEHDGEVETGFPRRSCSEREIRS